MRSFFVLAFIIINVQTHAQVKSLIPQEDSAQLHDTWKIFLNAVNEKDPEQLRKISLPMVNCLQFSHVDSIEGAVAIDTFSTRLLLSEAGYFKKMFSGKYTFGQTLLDDYSGKNLPGFNDDLDVYDVSFAILAPGELSPQHEGVNATYQFIKRDGKFIFFGMYTFP
jgi:hypothetical protein